MANVAQWLCMADRADRLKSMANLLSVLAGGKASYTETYPDCRIEGERASESDRWRERHRRGEAGSLEGTEATVCKRGSKQGVSSQGDERRRAS